DGNIGQLMAVEAIPGAARANRIGPVSPEDPLYQMDTIPQPDLPVAFNPEQGFLVSSNNIPMRFEQPLIAQGNSNDRLVHIQQVLADIASERPITTDDLRALQRDVYSSA